LLFCDEVHIHKAISHINKEHDQRRQMMIKRCIRLLSVRVVLVLVLAVALIPVINVSTAQANAEQRVLFVNVDGGYDGDAVNIHTTLINSGAIADYVHLASDGQAASLIESHSYDQIWVFDLSTGSDSYPSDWAAIAEWFNTDPTRPIICDGRMISSYWSGRWTDEGQRLTANYYYNMKTRGGGLLLGTDHSPYQTGINALNGLLGLNPFVGDFYLNFIPVDTANPLMTNPNDMGSQLFDDSSPGQTPYGLQPNGRILYTVAWHSGNPDTPGISSTIEGVVGFHVAITSPPDGASYSDEQISLEVEVTEEGSPPYTFDWTSDIDGSLGSGATLEIDASSLSPGLHTITVTAVDDASRIDDDQIQITIDRDCEPVIEYTVIQDSIEYPVEPISRAESVQAFYDYDGANNASSDTGLEESETSILFLYEDENTGDVSLVFIHDISPDTTGGQVTYAFSGIPDGATFAVQDDDISLGDGPYSIAGGISTVAWTWSPCCTDGGALSPSSSTFEITINPTFTSGISFWTYLTGTSEIALDPSESVIIRAEPVVCQNQPPVAEDDAYATDEDTLLTVAAPGVLGNDTDADGDPITAVLDSDVSNGALVLNADGSFSYDPEPDFCGTDSFTYVANDGQADSNVATVTITVDCVNDPPVADDDTATTDEDTPITIDVLANDSDVDGDSLTVDSVTLPANGTATINPDGTITYTPDSNYYGPDTFSYTISDGNGGTNTADVEVTVTPMNDLPLANISEIDDATIPLPVTVKVTPQTLNMERSGRWVKVHICDDSENTPQQIEVTLDGSGSSDPEGDPLTYDWTLTGPDGDIPVTDDVVSQTVTLPAGSYTVTLVVNDGADDSPPATETFTLGNETIEDIATANPEDFTLNGVVGSEVKGGDDCLVISFDDDAIAATVAVGLVVEMRLEGRVSGVDYIDVIQDRANGKGRGKSELKSEVAALSHNDESGPKTNNGKGNGKESAPGQNK
jgi:hypothetical protein